MRTSSRLLPRALSLAALAIATSLPAQVLARPGWAGSGVTIEPWWRHAVFYRIHPAVFQDSNADGKGDLAGIAQRLGYLQSLNIDAIVLAPLGNQAPPFDPTGFDDLARAATGDHIRILIQLPAVAEQDDAKYLASARNWLTQGVAGLYLDTATLPQDADRSAHLVTELGKLVRSFPGDRILVASAPTPAQDALTKPLTTAAALTASTPLLAKSADAASLRLQFQAALNGDAPEPPTPAPDAAAKPDAKPEPTPHRSRSRHAAAPLAPNQAFTEDANANPLLVAAPLALPADATPDEQRSLRATLAAMMLASRDAVMLDAGDELGLAPLANGTPPLMAWTPTNITPKPPAPEPEPEPAKPAEPAPAADPNSFGTYHAYVAPPPPKPKPKPRDPNEVEKVDIATLPGFTAGELPADASAPDAKTLNVATEDADASSLLNFYRRLIQYHHGHPTLRNGTEFVLNHDTLNAVVWLRRAPQGAPRSATITVIANLSDKPLAISLADDLRKLQVRPGTFRTLLTSSSTEIFPQAFDHISLPPYAVYVGELYH